MGVLKTEISTAYHWNGLVNEKDMLWNVWQWKRYALERLARREKGVLRAAHTYTANIRECPPPPPRGLLQPHLNLSDPHYSDRPLGVRVRGPGVQHFVYYYPPMHASNSIQCVPEKRKPINRVNFSENCNDLSEKVYIVTKFSLSSFFWHQLQDVLAMHEQARTILNGDVKNDLRRMGI